MLDPAAIKKILVINLAYLGDVILSTPAVRALKAAYPGGEIDMLVIPSTAPVANGNPYIRRVIVYDKRGRHRNLLRLWELIKQLRAEKYDLAVAMNFALRSSLMAWATGAKYRLGYDAQHAAPFLTHVASSSRAAVRHETENYLALLEPLGIITEDTSLTFRVNQEAVVAMRSKVKLTSARPAVAVCPYGRHPLNSWTDQGYAELIKYFSQDGDCYLIGGQAEKESLEKLNALSGGAATVLAGTLSISELAALLQAVDLLISVDTGPLHIAGAVGTPILGLFGRSDFRVWGPKGVNSKVLCTQPPCWPCYQRECDHHDCMGKLGPAEVIATAVAMLKDRDVS
ncbi:lipopolysaccharide heptosyltransferase II [Anaeroselena agilis]|uniref:lipopolysaccharide heptosyltransferase II n=1 Tax=Anaeroselena agilis TaxID=3063788 RepID=A0ABU3P586_9FIRM|nr:lipopolysaccharide heptosyltransferase II [Selenomonadales bacterium 4137-cl]